MKKMNKLLSLVLVLAIALSLAIPAMAAPVYSITIQHPRELTDHVYEAYQIFTGNIDATGNILSDVEWGNGIDAAGLLADLELNELWKDKVEPTTSAQQMADLLSHKETTDSMMVAFRRAAGANLTATVAASAGEKISDDPLTYNNKDASGNYSLILPAAGYYLVKDKDGTLDNTPETATNYILRVVGEDTLNPKGSSVTVDKNIMDGGTEKKAADYSIGDTVHFVVTGTMPSNLSAFTTSTHPFFYEFGDIMSEGLTYTDGTVKIYIENHGEKLLWENPAAPAAPYYTVSYDSAANKLAVTFADLLDAAKTAGRTIDASTILYLEYDAVLNEKAEIGEPGNINAADITFSNDPYSNNRGKTPEDYAWAFTWELDVTKVDDQGNKLANAEFVFYRLTEGAEEYVILNADNTVKGWTKTLADATTIVSPAGGLMPIIGLEADTYFLKETKSPDGYNLLDEPIEVVITATAKGVGTDGYTYEIENITIKMGLGEQTNGDVETGIVAGNVVNKSGAVLPETGGIGTTIFYLLGSTMALAAVILLITKKRMSI